MCPFDTPGMTCNGPTHMAAPMRASRVAWMSLAVDGSFTMTSTSALGTYACRATRFFFPPGRGLTRSPVLLPVQAPTPRAAGAGNRVWTGLAFSRADIGCLRPEIDHIREWEGENGGMTISSLTSVSVLLQRPFFMNLPCSTKLTHHDFKGAGNESVGPPNGRTIRDVASAELSRPAFPVVPARNHEQFLLILPDSFVLTATKH